MEGGKGTKSVKVGTFLALLGIALPLSECGWEVRGVELSSGLGTVLLGLAALSFLTGLGILFLSWLEDLRSWIKKAWTWTWSQIRERWPFALARTVKQLRADSEGLVAERDAFELTSRQFKGERDGQVRGRCFEVACDLFVLHKELDGQESEGAICQYREGLQERVDTLRSDLMQLGWWNPKKETREKLEYPAHPDDLLSLGDYLNASCGHGFC